MRGPRRGPPWRHGRPPLGWVLARGAHRVIVLSLGFAVGLGALTHHLVQLGVERGAPAPVWVLGACLGFGMLWALGWATSWRVVWPMRQLAGVAAEIRRGHLESRAQLPTGAGEVGEVGDALRGVSDRVAKQLQDQRALLAAVSHELRSPLGRARVLVEMAREGVAPADGHDQLQAEIDAMDALVGDLLAAARIDFEAVAPRPVDAADLARRALDVAHLPPETLVLDSPPGLVEADPTLLTRALAGLLDNARRYGGTTVELHVRGRADFVRFEVRDDGPGLGPDPEQAFQPFWRGPGGGAPAPRGEGLGLALVRQIAEAHGGEAGGHNRPEGGAVVWIEVRRG